MRSYKDVRKTIIAVMAAIAVVSLFSGCTPEEERGTGVSAPDSGNSTVNDVSDPTSSSTDSSVSSDNSEESAPVSSSTTESSNIADNTSALPSQLPTTVVDPNENQVPAQTTPIVIDTPSSSTKPENPKWTEEAASGTMYVNTNYTHARKEAVQGSTSVKVYNLNETVTVTAKTSTGYYKLSDGSYIHNDYLSAQKIVIANPPQPSSSTPTQSTPTPSSSGTPKDRDIKVINGIKYTYISALDEWIETGNDAGCTGDGSKFDVADGEHIGHAG